jgi:hypothetical protein
VPLRAPIVAFALFVLCAGCGPDHVYLVPAARHLSVAEDGPPAVKRRVPADAVTGGLDLAISSDGAAAREEDGHDITGIGVRVIIENRGDALGSVSAGEATLTDRFGRTFRPQSVRLDGSSQATMLEIAPGERHVLDFSFEVRKDPTDPGDLPPLRFELPAAYQGQQAVAGALFLRRDYSPPPWYGPYYYYYYGPAPGYNYPNPGYPNYFP